MDKLLEWRWWWPRIADGLLAVGEAAVALTCSCLWVVVLVITYGLDTSGVGFLDACKETLAKHFEPTDALQYLTAILSSTTAYTLFRLWDLRNHIYRVVILLLTPALLWFLATPLLMLPEPPNEEFAGKLAIVLISAGVFVWWFSLFNQRRVLDRTPAGPNDAGARKIIEELEHCG